MSNLLDETIEDFKVFKLSYKDIIFIGSEETGHSCTWSEFQDLANIEYDSGYGGQEIASDLIIVFKNGAIMSRSEYDGSEAWILSKPFKMPQVKQKIYGLKAHQGWLSLAEISDELGDGKQMKLM